MFLQFPTVEIAIVTLIVTLIRTVLEASPTILGGIAVAAYLRTQTQPDRLQAIFPGEGVKGVLRAALIGATLPVCSIGVLPVLRELRRMGLSTSKLVTLGIVAPILNPFSLLYGLVVLSSTQLLMIIVVSAIVAIALGDLSSRFSTRSEANAAPRPRGLTGGTRLRNLLIAASRLMTGQTLLDLLIVILVSALTASMIRSGAFYLYCESSKLSGPAIVSLLSLPQYVSPTRGVIQFAGIGNANLSIAAGLAIYVFGTSLSAANLAAFIRWYGMRRVSALAIVLFSVVATAAYFSVYALPAPTGDPAETSALDGMTRPSSSSFAQIETALTESLAFLDPLMVLGGVAGLALIVTGIVVRFSKIEFRDDDAEAVARQNAGRLSKAIPASQLGAVAVIGFGGLFCLSTYILFPSPDEFVKEMQVIRLDANIAIQRGKVDEALDRIAAWDSAAAKVPVGAAIRGAFPTSSQRNLTRDLRSELHRTREFLRQGDLVSARKKIPDLDRLLSETKGAFTGGAQ